MCVCPPSRMAGNEGAGEGAPTPNLAAAGPPSQILERILYTWAIRHPASGYVQGINDLVTPFFTVFLQDYVGMYAPPRFSRCATRLQGSALIGGCGQTGMWRMRT
jgi:hypothetical protein